MIAGNAMYWPTCAEMVVDVEVELGKEGLLQYALDDKTIANIPHGFMSAPKENNHISSTILP